MPMQPMITNKEVSSESEVEQITKHQILSGTGRGNLECMTCGKFHHGAFHHMRFICNLCGQANHIKKGMPLVGIKIETNLICTRTREDNTYTQMMFICYIVTTA